MKTRCHFLNHMCFYIATSFSKCQISLVFTALTFTLGFSSVLCGQSVVFDNGVPNLLNSVVSDFDFPLQTADNLIVANDSTIGKIRWWGVYGTSGDPGEASPDNFTIRIFDTAGIEPSSEPLYEWHVGQASRVETMIIDQPGFDLFQYESVIGPTDLQSGDYFLSVVNDTPDTTNHWFWSTSDSTGNAWTRMENNSDWLPRDFEFAFVVESIPEPSCAIILLVVGTMIGVPRSRLSD